MADTENVSTRQEGDTLLYNTTDGGEVISNNGVTAMTSYYETAAYLSMWGGNIDDPGEADKTKEWWANKLESDDERKLRSKTQHLLQALPATPANLQKVKKAAESDLAWFLEGGHVDSQEIVVYIPRLNWIKIDVSMSIGDEKIPLSYEFPWSVEQ